MQVTCSAGAGPLATPAGVVAPSDYLYELLEDEVRLGELLRWGNIARPVKLDSNFWLWGTCHGERGTDARLARTFMPRWRRNWAGAGELVVRCGLSIQQGPQSVAVTARSGHVVVARFADFPNPDDAIYYAMCKASIACLAAAQGQARETPARTEA